MKLALYSAVYGTYEATAKPLPPDLGIPAIMLTDNEQIAESAAAGGWTVVFDLTPYDRFTADPANGDPAVVTPMLAHKYWKTHPVEATWHWARLQGDITQIVDASIWVDGNMRITMAGPEWVARNVAALGDDEWSLMAHPWRSCVYTEHAYTAAVCAGRYSVEALQRQIDAVRASSHPEGWGLFATGHMVRRHTNMVNDLGELWWRANVMYSHQDQLSLPPLLRVQALLSESFARHESIVPGLGWNANLPWAMWSLDPHGT
jgi:hypothetical protein